MMRHHPRDTIGQHWLGALFAYAMLDVLMAAAGMGVPVFCILLAVPVGAFCAARAEYFLKDIGPAMRRVLRYSLITSGVTLVVMTGFWWWLLPYLPRNGPDVHRLAIPLILYEPKLSLIGWVVLMLMVAPAAQFVVMLASAFVVFAVRLRRGWGTFPD